MNPFFEKFHLELKDAFRDPENCFLALLNAFQQPLAGFDFFMNVLFGQAAVIFHAVAQITVITADAQTGDPIGIQRDFVLSLVLINVNIGDNVVLRRIGNESSSRFWFQ